MQFNAVEQKRNETQMKACRTYQKWADKVKEFGWIAEKKESVAS